MLNIYITGASGFVGQYLSVYLKKTGSNVISVDLRKPFDDNIFDGADVVVHLAGKAHDLKKPSNPEAYYEINTRLAKKVFDIFLKSPATTFIGISSIKAVKDSVSGILTEEALPDPQTHYGKSKLLADQYILSKYLVTDKRVFIIRPCMIHGPGNKGNLNLLYKVAEMGIPYPLAAFENRRSFLSIENLSFVIKELAERNDIESGIYNIADNTPLSTNQVMRVMSKVIFKKVRLWKINKPLIKAIARIGDLLPFPLNSERLRKLTENYVVSNEKLIAALKKPLPLTSEEGLIQTIQSFRDDR